MTENTPVSRCEQSSGVARSSVAAGSDGIASEAVQEGFRLLEEQQAVLAALRTALLAGEQSGSPTEFDFAAFLAGNQAPRNSPG